MHQESKVRCSSTLESIMWENNQYLPVIQISTIFWNDRIYMTRKRMIQKIHYLGLNDYVFDTISQEENQ